MFIEGVTLRFVSLDMNSPQYSHPSRPTSTRGPAASDLTVVRAGRAIRMLYFFAVLHAVAHGLILEMADAQDD
jgi:hypothetical protein